MNRRAVLSLVLAIVITLGAVAPVFAQDQTPVPGPKAAKALIPAANIGAGWTLAQTVSPDAISPYSFKMSPDVFSEGAAGIYLGPSGAQIILVSLLVTTNRVAIRQSWQDANSIVSGLSLMASSDYSATRALQGSPPPKGCVEAERTVQTEQMTGLPVGTTVCAFDPDGIFVAIVIGEVAGKNGPDASDAVVAAAVSKKPVG